MGISESHPLARETINVRSADLRGSVTADVPVTQVVGKNDHDIWL